MATKVITVRVPSDVAREVEAGAEKQQVTVNEFMKQMTVAYLDDHEVDSPAPEKYRSPRELAVEALEMTRRVIGKVSDETATQIIGECGKSHLLKTGDKTDLQDYSPEAKAQLIIDLVSDLSPEAKIKLGGLLGLGVVAEPGEPLTEEEANQAVEEYLGKRPLAPVKDEEPAAELKDPIEGEFEFLPADGDWRNFQVYASERGLKEPECISTDILTGQSRYVDLSDLLVEEPDDSGGDEDDDE